VKHYCWNDWKVNDYKAISVWDFMTDWQKSLRGYVSGLFSFLFPAYFLKGPGRVTLERWDALNQIKKTVGIGELDNHASVKKLLGISFVAFPFQRAFRFIRTHVLTDRRFSGNSRQDTDMVFQALLHGRCYFALEYFRPAQGFQFFIEHDKQEFYPGDSFKLSKNARLSVSCPEKARIRIIKNGRELLHKVGSHLSEPLQEAGVYRVEAFLKSAGLFRPWIFSNPIFVQ